MTKTVAITGATGTLGRVIAQRFARWSLHLCSASGGKVEPVPNLPGYVFWPVAQVDVTVSHSVSRWFDDIGSVDALVTCAGISLVTPSLEMSSNQFRSVLNVNLKGTFLAIQAAIKAGATRIVTIGSIHGCTPTSYPQRAAYTASKAGVMGLTQALAVEFAPMGVAVNCVAPGHLPALMLGTNSGQDLLDAARDKTPLGRLVTPEEVAEVVFWLCNDAPISLTGQTIVIDGGFTQNTFSL